MVCVNILENKYNLFFYWYFLRWEIICIYGVSNFLKEYSFLGEVVEIVLVYVGMVEKKIIEVWKKIFYIDMETIDFVLGI